MVGNRNQEVFGIFLAVLGLLFLLVNNNLLWFGWEVLWPTMPFLLGLFLLRVYAARRKPRQLFLGSFLVQFGLFFFIFSSGILPWESMDDLWPTITLITGISLLAVSGVVEPASSALVIGLFFVIFSIVSYLSNSGAIASHLSEPFVRIWPLALVVAGVLVFLRARAGRTARDETGGIVAGSDAGRDATGDGGEPEI
ncbi:MAG: hypothetical protein V3V49_07130 [Candidatus Krumholzibacteria bacterium]